MTTDVLESRQAALDVVPRAPPRERLINAATRLFCKHGINATGIDAVVEEAGTAKTTLYKLFGSKERLVEAVLENDGRRWRDWFIVNLDAGNESARVKLDRVFPLMREWFAQDNFAGCAHINAVAEHDKNEERLRAMTKAHKVLVLDQITALAREAGAPDANALAHQIGLLMDGAIIAAMVTRDVGVADAAGKAASILIDACVPRAGASSKSKAKKSA